MVRWEDIRYGKNHGSRITFSDFNYVRDENDRCVLIPGMSPVIPECEGDMEFYYLPTGYVMHILMENTWLNICVFDRYRKTAATTCEGGLDLDKGDKRWCPGKSYSSGRWVVYVVTPVAAAAALVACLHYRKHGRLGRIHLPDAATAQTTRIASHPIFAKVAGALLVIPVAIVGVLSRIPMPQSWSDITGSVPHISLPSWLGGGNRNRGYSALGQDESAADVLLDDYDGSDQLLDEAEEDADEL